MPKRNKRYYKFLTPWAVCDIKRIMKILRGLIFILFFSVFIALGQKASAQTPFERKIVVFKSGISSAGKSAFFLRHQLSSVRELRLVNGAAISIPQSLLEKLVKDEAVLRIDPDVEIYATGWFPASTLARRLRPTPTPRPTAIPTPTPTPISQTVPWGISQILADQANNVSSGSGIKVGVIDTGINRNHPDLKGNLAGCLNFISSFGTCEDDNGHGTHVSGTIAAQNNNFGVVGVAPEAKIYALKVLNRKGSGYLSDIITALDWAVTNHLQVVNMSLGTSSDVISFHEAVKRVYDAGITQVAAAGNSSGAVIYPAAYSEVIAVSATDKNNNLASWSSRGPQVDLATPGVDIYSTYLKGTYKTLSGTSMAAPHVTGTVVLLLSVSGKCDLDGNGICSPVEIQQRLEATATDLGVVGKDSLFGAGLVNAFAAVTAP